MSTAYVLIHGLAGSRDELSYLYDYLTYKGLGAFYLILKGHEKSNKELARATYKQWLTSAEEQISSLKMQYEKIVIIGFSMGGLIAINLCDKFQFEKIVFVNTPIQYWDIKKIASNIYNDLSTRNYSNIKRYFTASTDKPLRTLIQFVILLNKSKQKLTNITCDALVLQSRDDDTVQASSAAYIFSLLQGKKQIKYYNDGSHQILSSEIRDTVFEDIYKFIKN